MYWKLTRLTRNASIFLILQNYFSTSSLKVIIAVDGLCCQVMFLDLKCDWKSQKISVINSTFHKLEYRTKRFFLLNIFLVSFRPSLDFYSPTSIGKWDKTFLPMHEGFFLNSSRRWWLFTISYLFLVIHII